MGWNEEEKQNTGMRLSSKILLSIIICIILIIFVIGLLILSSQQTTFSVIIDGNNKKNIKKEDLVIKIDGITYLDIEKFASLVGYEFHNKEEYKTFTKEDDKCYVKCANETATFYLNDDKVCKLPVNAFTEDYQEYTTKYTVKEQNGKMYADIGAISLAFNTIIEEKEEKLIIHTLDYLVGIYDTKVKEWGFSGISEEAFENKKSLLYGYLIVKKENGNYKIIDNKNTKEIVSDKYNKIEFVENTKEFFVTNSLGQIGIINLDGTTKIEPTYESIAVLNKESNLYLVKKNTKYGVVKSGNSIVIYYEYDKIGLNTKETIGIAAENQYLILNTLIPVCKNNKWGAFDKNGNLVLNVEYDSFGCNAGTVEVQDVKKVVEPVFTIERCNGIVVEKNEKYGIVDVTGKKLVSINTNYIYSVENAKDENSKYFMLYNNEELNIIEELIKVGIIKDENVNNKEKDNSKNTISNNTISNNSVVNTINNEITNTTQNSMNTNISDE